MAVYAEISEDEIVRRVLSAGRPDRIVLFGSRARKSTSSRSDFDILIVESSHLPRSARATPYYSALSDLPVEVDVVVFTPEEIEEWQSVPQVFVTTALREGTTLYERQG